MFSFCLGAKKKSKPKRKREVETGSSNEERPIKREISRLKPNSKTIKKSKSQICSQVFTTKSTIKNSCKEFPISNNAYYSHRPKFSSSKNPEDLISFEQIREQSNITQKNNLCSSSNYSSIHSETFTFLQDLVLTSPLDSSFISGNKVLGESFYEDKSFNEDSFGYGTQSSSVAQNESEFSLSSVSDD